MINKQKLDSIKNAPNGFCLAKWYQVTIDLSRGYTHSCHHPMRHKIPVEEIIKDPSALHNTHFKMLQRKLMLDGIRPPECDYCWKIEDTAGDHLSDRFIKSTDNWAYDLLDETLKSPWDKKISPTYVEVIFSSDCNLNCAYCMADVSSSIESEMQKFGPYPVTSNQHRMPREKAIKENNPYVTAFWLWFPEMVKTLRVFRITGGEPLLSKETFKVLDYLIDHPAPNLSLAINTNLSYSSTQLQKLISQVKVLFAHKAIKAFSIYTSLDGFDDQASYIRKGLDLNKFKANISLITDSLPESEIILMCTYNILSITSFKDLLDWIVEQKNAGKRITLDISYLKEPEYLRANLADDSLKSKMNDDLEYMKTLKQFSQYEINKYDRIVSWVNTKTADPFKFVYQADFYTFINEFDKRFKSNFSALFPGHKKFYRSCMKSYLWKKIYSLGNK
ncbi:twitch domain-containing radical SAM protein [Bacteriovorax sp. PP10]|uniref:Twitch domain-containing radical SAM protein n=1 Tax=Bacteriovorax antarcticus TaxID=3088717 RepID=A0ABU5VPK5_9BACT|nr:twitch domain-containing radical SAM protein [Bacteriovorax sp. PP10]MEA9354970.1 twitch domain-containing radical SAM protein [Bacteriovorax sp. PP10]